MERTVRLVRRALPLLLASLLSVAACTSGGQDDDDTAGDASTTTGTVASVVYEPSVEPADCDDAVPDDPMVECGVLTVPIDRTDPDAGDVLLPYAVLRSPVAEPQPDPIVYFSGGPGGDGREIAAFLLEIGIAGGARDVIVFDQRGTGASTPSLDCSEADDSAWRLLGAADDPAPELAIADDAVARCRARLVDAGVDLDAYDTPTTAADADDLRRALGIERWNLFGVSYGTTVALEVLRHAPEAVRAVVLDSVYPPDRPADASVLVENAQRAIDTLIDGCAADAACAAAHGDVGARLVALVDSWNADPYELTVDDASGQPRHLVITGYDVIAGLWNAMYDSELIAVLPSLVQPLLERLPIAEVVVEQLATAGIEQLTDSAEGVALSVDCADRQHLGGPPAADVLADRPEFASLLTLGGVRNCELWDVESVDPSFNLPVTSDVPALVLGTEYDPITPPADARRAARTLRGSTYVELPGLGHGAVFAHECPRSLLLAFFDAPGGELDTQCVETMRGPAWAP